MKKGKTLCLACLEAVINFDQEYCADCRQRHDVISALESDATLKQEMIKERDKVISQLRRDDYQSKDSAGKKYAPRVADPTPDELRTANCVDASAFLDKAIDGLAAELPSGTLGRFLAEADPIQERYKALPKDKRPTAEEMIALWTQLIGTYKFSTGAPDVESESVPYFAQVYTEILRSNGLLSATTQRSRQFYRDKVYSARKKLGLPRRKFGNGTS